MANKMQVPSNIDDPTVLRRFLTSLTSNINNNSLMSGTDQEIATSIINLLSSNSSLNFWETVANIDNLRNTILQYVQGNLETVILSNSKNIALVAEQFGTFYNQAMSASWYGLTVKAGGAVAGLEVGSLDPDVTTPDDERSYFRVIADNFVVGHAYEDLSDEEKQYLADNGYADFGTVYNSATKAPVPAIIVSWNNTQKLYEIFFNGIVEFNHVRDESTGDTLSNIMNNVLSTLTDLEETNDGIVNSFYQNEAPTEGMSYGDWWVDTNSNPLKAYRYQGEDGKNIEPLSWVDDSDNIIAKAYIAAATAESAADGKIQSFYSTTDPASVPSNNVSKGDFWVHSTTNVTKRRNDANTAWVAIDNATAINNGTTKIDGGIIKTASLSASSIGSGRIVNSSAWKADGTIDETKVTMDINLDEGYMWFK